MRAPSSGEMATVALGWLLATIYYATLSGITVSNDGSHYALTRALAEHGSFEISAYMEYTELVDYARVGDKFYSDRAPGTALLAALFYRAGEWLPAPAFTLPSLHDRGNPVLAYVLMLPVLCGVIAILLVQQLLLRRGVSEVAAWLACLAIGLGTLQWKYSSVLYSHATSGLLLAAICVLVCELDQEDRPSQARIVALGLLLGFSVVVEYPNALLLPLSFLFLASHPGRLRQAASWGTAALGVLVFAAIPIGFLLTYNTALFGGPLATSYSHTGFHTWTHSTSGIFSGSLPLGLQSLLAFAPYEVSTVHGPVEVIGTALQGLFWLSPVLVLCIPGFMFAFAEPALRRPAWFSLCLLVSYALLLSMHATPHGYTRDSRYLSPLLPVLAIPLAATLQRVLARPASSWGNAIGQLGFHALLMLSIVQVGLHIGFSYDYKLHWSDLSELAASPFNYVVGFKAIFPNLADAQRIWFPVALIAAAWLVFRCRPKREAANAAASAPTH